MIEAQMFTMNVAKYEANATVTMMIIIMMVA